MWTLDSVTLHCHDGPVTSSNYSLPDLTRLAGVSARTVRYYIAQGLLPGPTHVGSGARYPETALDRLILIRRLQAHHLPLAEIRARLDRLDDAAVTDLLIESSPQAPDSAVEYIRDVLGGTASTSPASTSPASTSLVRGIGSPPHRSPAERMRGAFLATPSSPGPPMASIAGLRPHPRASEAAAIYERNAPGTGGARIPAPSVERSAHAGGATSHRSQWDRIELAPDIELHVRRPLSRLLNRRVDRLIARAREILTEDEP